MLNVLDAETNMISPYKPDSLLVSVGFRTSTQEEEYLCFNHREQIATPNAKRILQDSLDRTTLLVGHNLKFDLSWLYECGFTYDGEIHDTMLAEYIAARGRYRAIDLSSCCVRRGVDPKLDITKEYLAKGISFFDMPWDVVEPYGRQDIGSTWDLYKAQEIAFLEGSM